MSVQKFNHASTMSSLLNALKLPPSVLEIDSMCKYVVVALGIADIYLRGNASGYYRVNKRWERIICRKMCGITLQESSCCRKQEAL